MELSKGLSKKESKRAREQESKRERERERERKKEEEIYVLDREVSLENNDC